MKKLYRSEKNKVFGGVIGGIGEYYDVDPVILRLVFVAITLVTAVIPGVFFYIVALVIVPKKTERKTVKES